MKKSDKSNNKLKPAHAEYLYVGIDEKGALKLVEVKASIKHLVAIAGMALAHAAETLGGDFDKNVRKIANMTINTEKSINK